LRIAIEIRRRYKINTIRFILCFELLPFVVSYLQFQEDAHDETIVAFFIDYDAVVRLRLEWNAEPE